MGLMCVALSGFHDSSCTYTWTWTDGANSTDLSQEVYPVLYCSKEGIYSCTVLSHGHQGVGKFNVFSKYILKPLGTKLAVTCFIVLHIHQELQMGHSVSILAMMNLLAQTKV